MKTLKSKYQIQEQKIIIRKVIMKSGKNIHKDGQCRVYIELISFFPGGKRSTRRIPTPVFVAPKYWDSKKWDGMVTSKDPEHVEKNGKLDELYFLYCLQLQQRETGTYKEGYNPDDLVSIDDMFPKKVKKLTDYLDDYIEYRKKTNCRNTTKNFSSLKTRIEQYEKDNNLKLTFEDINLTFSDNFHAWMLLKEYKDSTIGKTYTLLITFLHHYYDRMDELNIRMTDKFKNRRFRRGNTKASNDAHPLSRTELDILISHKFDNKQLELTKKRFLLGCSTGMRYSDFFNITPSMIRNGNIIYYPQKTRNKLDNKAIVPLNDTSKGILREVNYDSRLLYVSNQKYNDSLKDMFKDLNKRYEGNIFEIYHSYDARDTFISHMIMEGVDVPSIMKMVGQSSWIEMRSIPR